MDQRLATQIALTALLRNYQPKETPVQIAIKQQLNSYFEAYLFLRSSDQSKYGSLMTTLQTQYSLGKDQYPPSINRAVNIPSQHQWDKKPPAQPKKDNSNSNPRSSGNDS